MTTPLIRKSSIETKPSFQKSYEEESEKIASAVFQKAEVAIPKAIDLSNSSRKEKLQRLSPINLSQVEALEKNFAELRKLCFEVCFINSKSKILDEDLDGLPSDDESELIVQKREKLEAQIEALEAPIERAEGQMKAFIQKLSNENHEIGIKPEFFSDWWQLNRMDGHKQELSLKFMEEQLLNRCVNQLCFFNDVQTFIEEKKAEIIGMFYQNDPVSLDLKHVSFKLFSSGSETHNRGKLPIKIVFFLGETELFSIFYKPRDAQVDEKIIQTFSDLNVLSKEEKSSDAFLPVYKIVNLVNNGESLSLWEFIEGEHLQGNSAGDVIKILSISEQEKKSLYQQLLRLESVCTFLNISDLHLENLVFTHLGQGSPQVIPVDLESAQPGNATGLFSIDPEILPFTKAEITILEKSKERIGECSVRFVPIPTSHFLAGLTRCDSFVLMASFIQGAIQKKSYALCIPKDEPQNFISQTRALEQQSFDLAVCRAKKLVEDKTSIMVHRESRKICSEAFQTFEKNIQAAFPYDDCRDLISLTLKSRENLFFIDLKNRVTSILRNPDQA